MRKEIDELIPFNELDRLARPVVEPLMQLARRTRLIYWFESRCDS